MLNSNYRQHWTDEREEKNERIWERRNTVGRVQYVDGIPYLFRNMSEGRVEKIRLDIPLSFNLNDPEVIEAQRQIKIAVRGNIISSGGKWYQFSGISWVEVPFESVSEDIKMKQLELGFNFQEV